MSFLKFFGLSDKSIVDFVIASGAHISCHGTIAISLPPSASSSKTTDALFSSLHAAGLPDTPASHAFISEVHRQAPRKRKHGHSDDAARKQAEKDAKSLRKQQFSFVLDDDPTPSSVTELRKDRSKGSGKDKRDRERHARKRESDAREWESDEEEQARKRRKADEEVNRAATPDEMDEEFPEDEGARRERERDQDLRERDEFSERVRRRDKDKTKKVVEDRSSKASGAAAEAAQRRQLADDSVARTLAMPSLRERSRQEYLTKRELQQVELLRQEIADDEGLFRGMRISKREQRELDRKKEVLRLVEERLKIDDKWDGYMLPEDYITEQGKIDKKRKENVLYQRYEDAKPKDDQFVTDVDQWEASQTKHSTFKTGAMDKSELVDDYEYVFDESQTIKFVMDRTMDGEGHLSAKDKLLQQQIEAAEARGKWFFDGHLIIHSCFFFQFITKPNPSKRPANLYPYTNSEGKFCRRSAITRS
jgi:pre-mRNA-splicing factor ATP-dependent RNA helicase DHX16